VFLKLTEFIYCEFNICFLNFIFEFIYWIFDINCFEQNILLASLFPIITKKQKNKSKSTRENSAEWKNLAVKIYEQFTNKTQRNSILDENKGKSGIYLWSNSLNGKIYIGQSKDLGNRRQGRLIRYLNPSYLKFVKGASLIRNAFLKYKPESFILAILEYCPIHMLDQREQYWLDLLKPEYNILNFVKSSCGYKHTNNTLAKMRGKRPNFSPSKEHRAAIAFAAKHRENNQAFKEAISKRVGFTVYVYDVVGNLINTYNSILRLKKAYNITMHHKTLYKQIAAGTLFNGHRFSLTPLNFSSLNSPILKLDNPNKARIISCINTLNSHLSKDLKSLTSAALYIKEIEGKSDRATIRNYINSGKLYKNKWLINESIYKKT